MMLRQTIIFLLVLLPCIAPVNASVDEAGYERANRAVDNRDFKRAEAILNDYLGSNNEDNEARFLYARVLSWRGKYDDALEQFNALLLKEPANSDYLLARANTYAWKGQIELALQDLRKAREISPEYKDVWRTEIKYLVRSGEKDSVGRATALAELAKTRFPDEDWAALLTVAGGNPVNLFSVEGGVRYDHLSNNNSPWKAIYTRFDVQTTRNHFAHIKYDATERFELSDHQVGAGYALPFAESWVVYAAGTYSPTHKVLANRSIELRLTKRLVGGFNILGGVIHAKYSQTSSQQALVTGEYYRDEYRFAYTYRLVDVLNAGTGSNHSIQLNRYFTRGNYVALALGAGEDVEFDGTATPPISDVVSFSLFGRYMYKPGWSLTYAYNYHEQGDLYNRNGFILGIRIDF